MSADIDGDLLRLLRQARRVDPAAALAALDHTIAGGHAGAGDLRWGAWLCAASGNATRAELLLLQARLTPDDRGEAWFAIGLLRLAREDARGAREAFVAACRARFPAGETRRRRHAQLRAYDDGRNRFAALEIFYDDFDSAFCCFPLLRAVRATEHQAYEFCFARAVAYLGHSTATADMLARDRELNGDTIWYHVNTGHFAWLDGCHDAADAHYRCARTIAVRDRLTPYHFNCGTLVWLTAAESERLLREPPEGRRTVLAAGWSAAFGERPATPVEIVLVVGCDGGYFSFFPKFLLGVLRALRASGQDRRIAVHCHLADPRPGQTAFLAWAAAWLRAAAPQLIVSYGTSTSAFPQPAFYTCLRFLALPAVMDWYGTGAIAMDIDSELEPEFFAQLDLIQSHDAALRMYSFSAETGQQTGGEPWSIGAHPTYLANTGTGRRTAAYLGAYIDAAYDPGLVTNWTIDQCAIARAYDLLLRPSKAPDALPARVLNLAWLPPIARLPDAGKAAFLAEDGGVTIENFATRAAAYLRQP